MAKYSYQFKAKEATTLTRKGILTGQKTSMLISWENDLVLSTNQRHELNFKVDLVIKS